MKKNLIFNIELTSKCNYQCSICPHRYYDFGKDMSIQTFSILIERLLEAGKHFKIKEIINSGYGETFLHNDLKLLYFIYRDFKIRFHKRFNYTPKISTVTNASLITKEKLDYINQSNDILKISFPTCNINNYSKITNTDKELGKKYCRKVKNNIELCMNNTENLRFHISPPTIEAFNDTENTIKYLIDLANRCHRKELNIVIFPNASNRAGNVIIDQSKNLHKCKNKTISGVKVNIDTEFKVFYPNLKSIIFALTRRFPCLWKHGSLSISVDGKYRHCINDFSCEKSIENIQKTSIKTVLKKINNMEEVSHCFSCNQHPTKINKLLRFIYFLGR